MACLPTYKGVRYQSLGEIEGIIKAELEQRKNIDSKISEVQARLNLPTDPSPHLPSDIIDNLEKAQNKKGINLKSLKDSEDYLYTEYKRLEEMKDIEKRRYTVDQINEAQGKLEEQLTILSEYRDELENPPEFAGARTMEWDLTQEKDEQQITPSGETKTVSPKQVSGEFKPEDAVQGVVRTGETQPGEPNIPSTDEENKPKTVSGDFTESGAVQGLGRNREEIIRQLEESDTRMLDKYGDDWAKSKERKSLIEKLQAIRKGDEFTVTDIQAELIAEVGRNIAKFQQTFGREPIKQKEEPSNDRENKPGIPGEVGGRPEPVKAKPDQETGGGKVKGSGNVQTHEEGKVIDLDIQKKKRAKAERIAEVLKREPETFEETVLQFLVGGGRFKTQDFIDHSGFGEGSGELRNARLHFLKKDGVAMDTFGDNHNVFGIDEKGPMDMINAIVDILKDNSSRWSVVSRLEKLQHTSFGLTEEDFIDPDLLDAADQEFPDEIQAEESAIIATMPEGLKTLIRKESLPFDLNDVELLNNLLKFVKDNKPFFTDNWMQEFSEKDFDESVKWIQDEITRQSGKQQGETSGTPAGTVEGGKPEAPGISAEEIKKYQKQFLPKGFEDLPPAKEKKILDLIDQAATKIEDLRSKEIPLEKIEKAKRDELNRINKENGIFGNVNDNPEDEFAGAWDINNETVKRKLDEIENRFLATNQRINKEILDITNELKATIQDIVTQIDLFEPPKQQDTYIGINPFGEKVYEDKNGNRYKLVGNIKVSAPVGIIPGSGFTVDSPEQLYRQNRTDFLSNEELEEFNKKFEEQAPPEEEPKAEEQPGEEPPKEEPSESYGDKNTIINKSRYEELKKKLRDKLNNLNTLYDPETAIWIMEVAAYHIEAGSRKFADLSQKMVADLGKKVIPYLKGVYENVKRMPGMENIRKEMDSADFVDNFKDEWIEKGLVNQHGVTKFWNEVKNIVLRNEANPVTHTIPFDATTIKLMKQDRLTGDVERWKVMIDQELRRRAEIELSWRSTHDNFVPVHRGIDLKTGLADIVDEVFDNFTQTVAPPETKPETSSEEDRRNQEGLTDPNPTDDQKKTGEYDKGVIVYHGMPIHIENARGSIRSGMDDQGKPWSNKMLETYGYFDRTKGKDGDEIDVFVGDNLESPNVYIIDQRNIKTKEFDEHKVMIGFDDPKTAERQYLSHYPITMWPKLIMGITHVSADQLKEWVGDGTRKTQPAKDYQFLKDPGVGVTYLGRYRQVSDQNFIYRLIKGPKWDIQSGELEDWIKITNSQPVTIAGFEHIPMFGFYKNATEFDLRGSGYGIFDAITGSNMSLGFYPSLAEAVAFTQRTLQRENITPERYQGLIDSKIQNQGRSISPKFVDDGIRKPELPSKPVSELTPKETNFIGDIISSLDANAPIRNTSTLANIAEKHGMKAGVDYNSYKELYDLAELALAKYVMDRPGITQLSIPYHDPRMQANIAKKLMDLQNLLPTETERSTELVEMQQYSTPLAYAYILVANSGLKKGDTFIEPSAGIGNLAIFAKLRGANVYVNELSPRRLRLLKELGFNGVTGENALYLNMVNSLKGINPDVIIMNPPFSRSGEMGNKLDVNAGPDQVISAVNKTLDNGRIIAIVGGGVSLYAPSYRDFWRKLMQNTTIRANILVSGNAYAKKGTNFDNRVIIIDKFGNTGDTKALESIIQGKAEDLNELIKLLQDVPEIQKSRSTAESPSAKPGGESTSAKPGQTGSALPGPTSPRDLQPGNGELFPPKGNGSGDNMQPDIRPGVQPQPKSGNDDTGSGTKIPIIRTPSSGGSGTTQTGDATKPAQPQGAISGSDTGLPKRQDEPATTKLSVQPKPELVITRQPKKAPDVNQQDYQEYAPEIVVQGAKEHPTKLVESIAMGSVPLPVTNYTPLIPQKVIDSGMISNAQIEDIILAGNAHQQKLMNGERRGFFLGAGTGYGKGNTIAGIILDNFLHGRRKAVWLSANPKAHYDSTAYWDAVGGDKTLPFWQNKYGKDKPITKQEGILLSTYDTLKTGFIPEGRTLSARQRLTRAESENKKIKDRIDQIVQWVGTDFDGVIVMDEGHRMANGKDQAGDRGTKKASMRALAGIELQRRLPNARILYSSATGATEVMNLVYSSRLGLWGEGTSFTNADDFINQIESAGLSAMEVVAKDLKAMGLFSAKKLSYQGVKYDTLTHIMLPEQIELYDRVAEAWRTVLENIGQAIDNNQTDRQKKSSAYSAFWGAHQRFFQQIILTMELPTMLEHMKKKIDNGDAPVIQLVNTNEAKTKRELDRARALAIEEGEDEIDLDALDLSPRDILIDYLTNSFPVQQFTETMDNQGNVIRVPVVDNDGNPVLNPESVAARDRLINWIEENITIPESPLDIIINTFGEENVAEVTGRTVRVVAALDDEGNRKKVEQKRSPAHAAADKDAFMDGKKQILVFSDAGGTGASFHSDLKRINQKQRIGYVLQAGWRPDTATQGMGRIHRSNQRIAPEYYLVTTDLVAQRRFLSSIARRLEQMGALTTGQRSTGGQGLFDASFNLESPMGRQALYNLVRDLHANRVPTMTMDVFLRQMYMKVVRTDDSGAVVIDEDEARNIKKFLNRIMSLNVDTMNTVFTEFSSRLADVIEFEKQQGNYNQGIQMVTALRTKKVAEQPIYTDPVSGAKTTLTSFDLTLKNDKTDWEDISKLAKRPDFITFAKENTSKNIYAFFKGPTKTDMYGRQKDTIKRVGIGHSQYIDVVDYHTKYTKIKSEDEAELEWNTQFKDHPETRTKRENIIEGIMLPIWKQLPDRVDVRRYVDENGVPHLGRYFPEKDIPQIIRQFNITSNLRYTESTIGQILKQNGSIQLGNRWRFDRVMWQGDPYVKITGPSRYDKPLLERLGAIFRVTSAMSMQGDFYIPMDKAGDVITAITKSFNAPISRAQDAYGDMIAGDDVSENTTRLMMAEEVENPLMKKEEFPGSKVADVSRAGSKFEKRVRAQVDAFTEETGEHIHVVKNKSFLPAGLRSRLNSRGAADVTGGVYDMETGEIYILLDKVRSTKHAREIILHEVLAHRGLRKMFGEKYDDLLDDIWQSMKQEQRDRIGEQYKTKDRKEIADEFLGEQAQKDKKLNFIQQAIAKIREWIRRMFNLNYSENDIAYLFKKTMDFMREQRKKQGREVVEKEKFAGEYTQEAETVPVEEGDIRSHIIGTKGVKKLQEAELYPDNINNLAIAKKMEKAGKDANAIWLSTGWEKGKDGKWRVEIPDTKIDLKKLKDYNVLGDFVEYLPVVYPNKALYTAYPYLKKITVQFDKRTAVGTATYNVDLDTIKLGAGRTYGKNGIGKEYTNVLTNVLLHEIQHGIQMVEGFAKGAGIQEELQKKRFDLEYAKDLWLDYESFKLKPEYRDFRLASERLMNNEITDTEFYEALLKWEQSGVYRFMQAIQLEIRNLGFNLAMLQKGLYTGNDLQTMAMQAYSNAAGEVEARNAQARNLLRIEQHLTPGRFSETEDTPREDQTVIFAARKKNELVAFHGTTSDFNEFNPDKIGSGEGEQAFGHGLYFSEIKDVARYYADEISKVKEGTTLTINGKPITDPKILQDWTSYAYLNSQWPDEYPVDKFIEYQIENRQKMLTGERMTWGYRDPDSRKRWEEAISYYQSIKKPYRIGTEPQNKVIYQVRIPDTFNWMRWDEHITNDQYNKIKKQAEREGIQVGFQKARKVDDVFRQLGGNGSFPVIKEMGGAQLRYEWDDMQPSYFDPDLDDVVFLSEQDYIDGFNLFVEQQNPSLEYETGEGVYDRLLQEFDGAHEVSAFLERAGIHGIKYPAGTIASGRTANNTNGFNYVVFDPTPIEITHKTRLMLSDDNTIQDPTFAQQSPEDPIIGSRMLTTKFERRREFIQDKMLSVRRLQEEIIKGGGTVDHLSDVYNDENRSASRSDFQIKMYKQHQWDPLVQTIAGIEKKYRFSVDDIQTYLMAKHAPERNEHFRKLYDTTDEVYAGKIRGFPATKDVSDHYVKEFEDRVSQDDIDRLWDAVRNATRHTLDRYFEDGFISRETYDQLTDPTTGYQYYIPLRGWKAETADEIFDYQNADIGEGFSPFKTAYGRESGADDPLPYIYAMAVSSIVSGNKNRVKQKALNLIRANKDRTDLFAMSKVYLVEDLQGNVSETITRPDQSLFDMGLVKVKYSPAKHPRITKYRAEQHELTVMELGTKYVITFRDPNVAIAINGDNVWKPELTRWVQQSWLGQGTRIIASLLTSKNPAFMPINMIRDVLFAATSHHIQTDYDAKLFLQNLPIAKNAILRSLKWTESDKLPVSERNPNQMDAEYFQWRNRGGETGYVHLYDMETIRKKMNKEFRALLNEKKLMDHATTNKIVRLAGLWLNNLAVLSENISRFATYLTLREKGFTRDDATTGSKNITVNFNRNGRITPLLNAIYAFFRANIQGGHTLLKLAKDYPVQFTKAGIGFIVLGYLVSELNRFFSPMNEMEGKLEYDRLSPYVRQNYMVLPNPLWLFGSMEDKFITIPMPWGFRALYGAGVIASDWAHQSQGIADGIWDMTSNFVDSFTPVNFAAGAVREGKMLGPKGLRPVIPTVGLPWYDIGVNEDFAGNKVFREQRNFPGQPENHQPQSELGMPYTNKYLKIGTQALNRWGGGDELRSAQWAIDGETGEITNQRWRTIFDWNPSKVEHVLEAYTGGVGTEINNVIKTVASAVEVAQGVPGAEVYARNIPVLRRLIRQGSTSDNWQSYLEYKAQVQAQYYFMGQYKKERMMDDYVLLRQYTDIRTMKNVIDHAEDRLKSIRNRIDRLKDKEDNERISDLYDQQDEIINDAVKRIKEFNDKKE